jgi:predicted RNase H-like nuclease (RuvC/YqgF family)
MSENIEQQAAPETQPPAEDKTDAMRVQLLEAKNLELKSEKQAVKKQLEDMQRQMADLQSNQQQAKQSQLAEAGEFKTLWSEASATNTSLQDEIAQLKQQLQDKDVAFQQQQIKATALNAFSQSGVHSPEHLFQLQKENLRLKDGNVVALVGGVEVDLQTHVQSLKSPGSGLDYMFNGSGARGMSAAGSSTSASGGKSWGSMGLMERIQLEEENPALAAQLKAQG